MSIKRDRVVFHSGLNQIELHRQYDCYDDARKDCEDLISRGWEIRPSYPHYHRTGSKVIAYRRHDSVKLNSE